MANSKNLRPPFALLRQAISHSNFDDKETRERVNSLLDEMEQEMENVGIEFDSEETLTAIEALQNHLKDLLTAESEKEERIEIESTTPRQVRSVGDIEDDDDIENGS